MEEFSVNIYYDHVYGMKKSDIDIIECIRIFESGAFNIYLTDEEGNYTGEAIEKRYFPLVWSKGMVPLSEINGVEEADSEIKDKIRKIYSDAPQTIEIPVLTNGKLSRRCGRATYWPDKKVDWNFAPCFPYEILQYRKIYLSSIEPPDMFNFFCRFTSNNIHLPPVELLTYSSLNELSSDDVLLIYAEDIVAAKHKIQIYELYNKMHTHSSTDLENRVFLSDDYAFIYNYEVHSLSKLIRKYDEGYTGVVVKDNNNNYCATVMVQTLKQHFPMRNVPLYNSLFVPYSEDEAEIKKYAAKIGYGFGRKEMPIVKDGKVVGAVVLGNGTARSVSDRKLYKSQAEDWDLISDETAFDFFGDKEIVLSSLAPRLEAFYKRFSDLLKITIYEDKLLDECIMGRFGFLIYGADVFNAVRAKKFQVDTLYMKLLGIEVNCTQISQERRLAKCS